VSKSLLTHASDALVIGAGPAGATAAILLAHAGWQVSLVEQHAYPRQKVCGECIAAGNFALLDELGIGNAVRRLAGAELTHVGWMRTDTTVTADMPPCGEGSDRYGRALGRDILDGLLLECARAAGVHIWQPARVRNVSGHPGDFRCDIDDSGIRGALKPQASLMTISASIIIDAHGSWESGPEFDMARATGQSHRTPQRASDLLAFKATFSKTALTPGLLPVVALNGGYGGLVVANQGRTTVALCLRRDALRALRVRNYGMPAGAAVETHLRESCRGIRDALRHAKREGSWLTVGPLRPGTRLHETSGVFRVGNASGESHPLIGEGISMALQSSKLLVESLISHADRVTGMAALSAAHHAYASAWRQGFLPRLRLAALYAHVAMRGPSAALVDRSLRRWPHLLTRAARLAGKARHAIHSSGLNEELL
jgi:menaquinone-9 beta-reductase